MTLGICTRYTYHESTYAAIRLANAAKAVGRDVSIFTMTAKPARITKQWDGVVVTCDREFFSRWASRCDTVLWTTMPSVTQVQWANKQHKRTIIFVLWHELDKEMLADLLFFDIVLCPTQACYDLLRAHGVLNCVHIPWDCGEPIHNKPADYVVTQPRLLLPLWDGNARRTEMTIIDVLRLALERFPQVQITVACNSSTIYTAGTLKLTKLASSFPDRLCVKRCVPPNQRFALYQSHDLTLWPTHFENMSAVAIQSIELGTPVLGFSFRPTNEVLDVHNSVVVHCAEEVNDLGLPRAIPDYECFDTALYNILRDLDYLRTLQRNTSNGRLLRRTCFNEFVSSF